MSSLKEIKSRIATVENTKKITLARQMISSAQLHRAQSVLGQVREYRSTITELAATLADSDATDDLALLSRRSVCKTAIVIMSSNNGMCGSFNSRVIKHLDSFDLESRANLVFYPIGAKIRKVLKSRGYNVAGDFDSLVDKYSYESVGPITDLLVDQFLKDNVAQVDMIYYGFKTVGRQDIRRETLLPLPIDLHSDQTMASNDILEPSRREVLEYLLPRLFRTLFYSNVVENITSEHASRMIAMQMATENADKLLDEMNLLYNKLRQEGITSELLDIVGGSFV